MIIRRWNGSGWANVLRTGHLRVVASDAHVVIVEGDGFTVKGDPVNFRVTLDRNELALINRFTADKPPKREEC